jgi:hypothetical protein
MYARGQRLPPGIHFFVSLGSHIFMSLQRILMKLRRFTKFGMINWTMEVIFCLCEKYEKLLILRDTFLPMSRNINNFSYFSYKRKTIPIDQFIMPNLVNMWSFIRIRCKVLLPGIHFFVKIGKKLGSHIFISLQLILLKLCIFTKFGMINRAVRLIF